MVRLKIIIVVLIYLVLGLHITAAQDTIGGDDTFPQWSPDGQQIAFMSNRDGNYEIYVMNADGSDTRNLTQSSNGDFQPYWSPDGQQIAFYSGIQGGAMDIMVMNPDGSHITNLTNGSPHLDQVSWSPDSKSILFSSMPNDVRDFYVVDRDGSNLRNISNGLTQNVRSDIQWSPDSQHIAFNAPGKLYITDTQGENLNSLLDHFPDISAQLYYSLWVWSPDSQHIAVTSEVSGVLYNIDITTNSENLVAHLHNSITRLEWTNDGQRILYTVFQNPAATHSPDMNGFHWVNLVDGQIQQIVTPPLGNFYASPDQSQVLYVKYFPTHDGSSIDMIIYGLMDLSSRTLKTHPYNLFGVEWSPDGQQLAASVCLEGEADADIYVFDPKTGQGQNLTSDDSVVSNQNFNSQCQYYG